MNEIDKFVAYLIAEECEGCDLCEPRLEGFREGVACVSQGRVSWFLKKAEEYKKARDK